MQSIVEAKVYSNTIYIFIYIYILYIYLPVAIVRRLRRPFIAVYNDITEIDAQMLAYKWESNRMCCLKVRSYRSQILRLLHFMLTSSL